MIAGGARKYNKEGSWHHFARLQKMKKGFWTKKKMAATAVVAVPFY